LGRDREALAWYATIAQRAAYELPYLAPAHRRQGEIYERLGDPAQALAHYRAFLRLWRDCDPALRPEVARVEARARALSAP
ncbi:MAG TPA: hypothetical protein VFS40_13760, partial [Gemmatimonadales bacterium]|nr:hypothetical protein [Gemmatimonadales bacterium]